MAVIALGGASLAVASRAGLAGLDRVLATVVGAAAAAVLEALGLGLLGLAGSTVALLLAALVTWGATAAPAVGRGPASAPGVVGELVIWWRDAPGWLRLLVGALVGLGGAVVAFNLRRPFLSGDGLTYHLPLAAGYVQHGHAAALTPWLDGVPVENYPVTNEVLLGWGLGLSRSWVLASLWGPAAMALLVLAGTHGLRALGVPVRATALAVAAVALSPSIALLLGGPLTDLPTLAWLVVAAALAARSRAVPACLPFALVAAGLSFGTKTTGSLVLLVVLGSAAWARRDDLRRLLPARGTGARQGTALPPDGPAVADARPARAGLTRGGLAAAAAVALGVGAVWSVRNLVLHGSPLWPLVASSFGDPVPPQLARVDDAFLSHPRAMLDGRLGDYERLLAGGLALLVGGLLAGLATRRRAVLPASALGAATLLAWGLAPYTGIDEDTALAVGALRYLMPCLAVCATALALAARDGSPRVARGAEAVLVLAIALDLFRIARTGFPYVPGLATVVVGVAAGALAAGALGRPPGLGRLSPRPARPLGEPRGGVGARTGAASRAGEPADPARRARVVAAGIIAIVAVAVALAACAPGYVARHANVGFGDAGLLRHALADPAFADGDAPVAMGPNVIALLMGPHLQHRLSLLRERTPCAEVRRRADMGWVVLQRAPPNAAYRTLSRCLEDRRSSYADPVYVVFAPGG